MIRRTAMAAVTMLVVALGLAACGDSDSADAGSEGSITKDEYIARADAVCLDVNKQLDSVKNFEKDGPGVIDAGIAKLRALPVPVGDEETVDSMIGAAEADVQKVQSGETNGPLFQEFHDQAETYGLKGGCTGNSG